MTCPNFWTTAKALFRRQLYFKYIIQEIRYIENQCSF